MSSRKSHSPSSSVSLGVSSSSRGSVSQAVSLTSSQPSLSSSGSVSSGIPSPSVSNGEDEMVRLNEEENAELFAHTTKVVFSNEVVGVPASSPVVLFSPNPAGSEGVISHVEMAPPEVTGVRDNTETFVISSRVETSYAIAIARSSDSSSASQSPSLSTSEGVLDGSNGSVPHPASEESLHPSLSSSGSYRSAIPSESVSSRIAMEIVTELVCPPDAFAQMV